MIHIIIGDRNECQVQIRKMERQTGKRIAYFGTRFGKENVLYIWKDNEKDHPRQRVILRRKEDTSEIVSK